jgi:clan AA aspartic protease (TIGR02281 family)
MKQALLALIVITSFFLGWLARDQFAGSGGPQNPVQLASGQTQVPSTVAQTRTSIETPAPAPSRSASFRELLNSGNAEEAMLLFERLTEADETLIPPLRAEIIAWLRNALQQGNHAGLLSLVDAYLARYYDDIDVLMILAGYQQSQGYPDEAARVFQYAFTYALQPAQREKVARFFQALVQDTDTAFSRQQQWVELLGFYQLLQSIGLGQPEFRLRQAMVCLELGDLSTARELLLPLREVTGLADTANTLLASMEPPVGKPPAAAPAGASIPLRRHGRHHLVQIELNEQAELTLMIDTGASITSLSQEAFRAQSRRSFFEPLGWRLFNTANGVVRGNIYRAQALRLGTFTLRDVELAVLDLRRDNDIDGLLGMNVLQHFRFEIDQDRDVLYLRKR